MPAPRAPSGGRGRFGTVPLAEAGGLISAHTVRRADITLRKGAVIGPEEAAGLARTGLSEIVVAALEPGDVGEDEAAARLAGCLRGANLRVESPFTGRCNLFAERPGVLTLDPTRIEAVNAVDEAVTVATLPRFRPVIEGEMIATVKIIPYAVPGAVRARACAAAGAAASSRRSRDRRFMASTPGCGRRRTTTPRPAGSSRIERARSTPPP